MSGRMIGMCVRDEALLLTPRNIDRQFRTRKPKTSIVVKHVVPVALLKNVFRQDECEARLA